MDPKTATAEDVAEAFKEALEREKPLFDFARYFLTTIAWWAAIAVAWKGFSAHADGGWTTAILVVFLSPLVMFGIILSIRSTAVLDRLVNLALGVAHGEKHPVVKALVMLFAFVLHLGGPASWMIVFLNWQ